MKTDEKISIVVPCYNEEETICDFYETTKSVLEEQMQLKRYEILFVDDGSEDKTAEIIRELSIRNEQVEFLSFSRNFGKESAMYAGLKYVEGDYIVIMDADLQHPPEVIPKMYQKISTGMYDMIATRRKNRSTDTKSRAFFGRLFYKFMNKISGIDMGNNAMDFRMFNKKARNAVLAVLEYNRFSKGIFEWIGFRTYWMEIEIADRKAGVSKWSFWKLFLYSLEGCLAFSTIPLALASVLGILLWIVAVIMIIAMVIHALITGVEGSGYATIVCMILLVGGVQLFCMGILGQYVSKAYLEVKRRPKFLIQDMSDGKKELYNEENL